MRQRPYQRDARQAIERSLAEHGSSLLVMATGLGKTIVFCHLIAKYRHRGKVLVLAHRDLLIHQAAQKIKAVTGVEPGIEMAGSYAEADASVIVSSIQTQVAVGARRMKRFRPADFSLVIVDEAHHAVASTYRRVIDYYRANEEVRVLGVTATPDRGDRMALGQVFDHVAFSYDILPGINDGWLVPIMQRFPVIEGLDYSAVHTNAGDFNKRELAREMTYERNLYPMAKVVADAAETQKTLVFAASKGHAERITEIINRYHAGLARFVTEDTPKGERAKTFTDYAINDFRVLVNVGIATEGFDQPDIDVVAMCRPTKSRALYCQMVGRGTRPLPGIVDSPEGGDTLWNADAAKERKNLIGGSNKPNLTVIDFVGNSGRHKLITTLDILGGTTLDDTQKEKLKAKLAKDGKAIDPIDAVRRHEIEMQRRAAEERARQARRRRSLLRPTVKYRWRLIDPFDRFDIRPPRTMSWDKRKPPTSGQLRMLHKAGIDTKGLDIKNAGVVCGKLVAQWRSVGITRGQQQWLDGKGVATKGLRRQEASAIIEWIKRTGKLPMKADDVPF